MMILNDIKKITAKKAYKMIKINNQHVSKIPLSFNIDYHTSKPSTVKSLAPHLKRISYYFSFYTYYSRNETYASE